MSKLNLLTLLIAAAFAGALGYNGGEKPLWLFVSLASLLVWASRQGLLRTSSVPRSPLTVIMAVQLLWLAALPTVSLIPEISVTNGLVLASLPLAYFVGCTLQRDDGSLTTTRSVIVMVAFVVCGVAMIEFGTLRSRPNSFFLDPNLLAAFCNACFFVAYGEFITRARMHGIAKAVRSAEAGFAAVVLVTQFMTTSLGGFLCFCGGIGLMTLIGSRFDRAFLKSALLVVLVAVPTYLAVYGWQGRPSPISRIEVEARTGGQATHREGTFIRERSAIYASTIAMIRDQPWYGSGPGTFATLYPKYRNPADQSTSGALVHNDYLQFLLEGGIPLLACLLGTLATILLAIFRSTRVLWSTALSTADDDAIRRLGIQIALLAVFLHAVPNFIFYSLTMSILLGLLLSQSQSPARATVDLARLITPGSARLIAAGVFAGLIATTGLTGVFAAVQTGQCSLRGCKTLREQPERMAAFAKVLIAIQPSWIMGNDYLIEQRLAIARDSSNPVERWTNAILATQVSSTLLSRYPAIYPQYVKLAQIIERYPAAAEQIAAGVPREPAQLYRRAMEANPGYMLARVQVATFESDAGNDAQAWLTAEAGTRWWKLNVVSDGDRRLLLDTALPLAIRTGNCGEAREMAAGLLLLVPNHPLATEVQAKVSESSAPTPTLCGLPSAPVLPLTRRKANPATL